MTWKAHYETHRMDAAAAAKLVRSRDRVFVGGNVAAPIPMLYALRDRAQVLEQVELLHLLFAGEDPLASPEMEGHFRHTVLFVGSADREAVQEGRAAYLPVHLHDIPQLFKSGALPIRVAIVSTAPPDEHGYLSLGVECLASLAAVEVADVVIAVVNDQMPRTLGDCFIPAHRVAAIVEVSYALPELPIEEASAVNTRIGQLVGTLVEDGATLQLGIGAIPDAVVAALAGKRDLGVHTEMVSDRVMDAIESGVITGARKTLHPGKVVATFAMGSRALYDYIDNNPLFEMHPADYTNNPFVIAQNDQMVAINSALEVDITGQVCAESVGKRIFSGFGGQLDFIRGAAMSKAGVPIIALPSTAAKGKLSRIVPMLQPGAGVVTTRADVHYVVTEYGIAQLYGKTLRQRVRELMEVAHPDFRGALEREAWERKILPRAF
ncbi:MAG: acetyl-CoA hydrolase/transferase family protein [Betaproteobacteria bacterium]|nr:acetyl-CoA hydrolase/transferase family protein [Betaproteobacteria bacterium]